MFNAYCRIPESFVNASRMKLKPRGPSRIVVNDPDFALFWPSNQAGLNWHRHSDPSPNKRQNRPRPGSVFFEDFSETRVQCALFDAYAPDIPNQHTADNTGE